MRVHLRFIGALVLLTATTVPAGAQFDEDIVKAAFIRNFVGFVEWPPERLRDASSLDICVFSGGPMATRLSALRIPPVRERAVRVRTVVTVPDVDGCHAVFIPAPQTDHIRDLRSAATRRAGLLTISEDYRRARTGAVINLFVVGGKVAFDVDLAAAQAERVQVSSKLLALAAQVHRGLPSSAGHESIRAFAERSE